MLLLSLPCSLLVVLLSAPHASSFFDPSPKGSLVGEESNGGAGEPQASSALTGAVAAQGHQYVLSHITERRCLTHHLLFW